jgi:hypothetical protein
MWLCVTRLRTSKLDFEFLHSLKLFDRNSQVRFHECKIAIGLQQAQMHEAVHSQ